MNSKRLPDCHSRSSLLLELAETVEQQGKTIRILTDALAQHISMEEIECMCTGAHIEEQR